MLKLSTLFLITYLSITCGLYAQSSDNSGSNFKTGPGNYEILTINKEFVKIPFKMHRGKPLMEVKINGEKATLMIDNGVLWDQVWLFGSQLVNKLDLKPDKAGELAGSESQESTDLYSSKNLKIAFEQIVFNEQPVLISPESAGFTRIFPGVDGQLCNTFFKHFIVEFDFINNEIILHQPKSFNYKGNGSILDMQLSESGTYSIPFRMTLKNGKKYEDRADIDLGGIYMFKVALNTHFQIIPPVNAKTRPFFGGTEYIATIENMSIGKYNFKEPEVVFGDEKTSRIHPKNLGVIGLPMFMKFKIIFDYFNQKIYIEPNVNYYK